MAAEDPWEVLIGDVVSPFGRHGELKVVPLTDDPQRFEALEEVFLAASDGSWAVKKIEGIRYHQNLVLLKVEGCDTIGDADLWRGAEVRIRRSQRRPLPEGHYYIYEIIGMEVMTDRGESLGAVNEVIPSPANDVYVTDQAMIPAVKEFVLKIDRQTRTIVVRDVEGLRIE